VANPAKMKMPISWGKFLQLFQLRPLRLGDERD